MNDIEVKDAFQAFFHIYPIFVIFMNVPHLTILI